MAAGLFELFELVFVSVFREFSGFSLASILADAASQVSHLTF